MDDGQWAAYEARTDISKDAYAQRLLVAARYYFQEQPWEGDFDEHGVARRHGRGGFLDDTVESVEMEGQGSDAFLVVLLHLHEYPDEVFGWRAPIGSPPAETDDSAPDDWAQLMPTYIGETIYSSPRSSWASEPDERGVRWIQLCFE